MQVATRRFLNTENLGVIHAVPRILSADIKGPRGVKALPVAQLADARRFFSRPLSTKSQAKIIFSGIQPTGVPHLGNYLGALRQWVTLQNHAVQGDDLIFCVVDLHAMTVPQDAARLRRWKRETLAVLLAVGLDPKRCTIFFQSTVPEHLELMWLLNCIAPCGYLSRMTQWKSKLALSDDTVPLDSPMKPQLRSGLFTYPVLQAADILLYGSTHVPVGEDQVQHLEFTRHCVDLFNASHGELLVKPQILLSPAKRVMSLTDPHLKMSKSHIDPRSRIQLDDSPKQVAEKIKQALTDSISGVSYDPLARPGVSNLLNIMSFLSEQSPSEIVQKYSGLSMRALKDEVTKCIVSSLAEIQERYNLLINDDDHHYLEDVALRGSQSARTRATATMESIKQTIGLI